MNALPAAQEVDHRPTLWWWAGIAAFAVVAMIATQSPRVRPRAVPPAAPSEMQAFHVFALSGPLDAGALRTQLEHLVDSGANAVSLDDIDAFMSMRRPLPSHPVLITIDEAGREALETLDPLLEEYGLTAVAFVSAPQVERGNIALASKRRLGQLAASGRWEMGLRTCETPEATLPGASLKRDRALLESWIGAPVRAAQCVRGWTSSAPVRTQWTDDLRAAGLALGFVPQATGATLRSDDPSEIRSLRIAPDDRDPEALARRAATYATLDKPWADDFNGRALAPAWIGDRQHARTERGALELDAKAGEAGASIMLAGTERWRDAQVDVELPGAVAGQCWISARHAGPKAFLRLGIVAGQVLLQKSDGVTPLRQLGVAPAPGGPVHLRLRVIGSRALAYVNGAPLLDRPAEIPDSLAEGPVSLAAWDPDAAAHARIERVEITPLWRHVALATADDAGIANLRSAVDSLWGVSAPRWRWSEGRATELPASAPVFEMFVRHHRLALLPAIELDALPTGAEWALLNTQALQWADMPDITGLNFVMRDPPPDSDARVLALRRTLEARGKVLAVTARPRG